MGLNLVVQAVGKGRPTANDREFFQRAYYKESVLLGKALLIAASDWAREVTVLCKSGTA